MNLYWKTLQLRRGITLTLSLTYDCSLTCDYCTLLMPTGKKPVSKISTLTDIKEFINRFPFKIKEVYITGGEPTLHKQFESIINFLLEKKFHVKVFTNLKSPYYNGYITLKPNYRLSFLATLHKKTKGVSCGEFISHYYKIKYAGFNIEITEIGNKKLLPYSKIHPFIKDVKELDDNNIRVAPDLSMHLGCYNHYKNKSE